MGEGGVDVELKPLRKPVLEKSTSVGRDLIWYRIKDESGKQIGMMQVAYDDRTRTSKLGLIDIDEEFQRMGYGTEIYKQIPSLPTPDGGNYTFRSSNTLLPGGGAKELWESLVRDGYAKTTGNGVYEMIGKSNAPVENPPIILPAVTPPRNVMGTSQAITS